MSDLLTMTLEDKLYRTKFEADAGHPHITVDDTACLKCDSKPCLRFCSGGVYNRDPNDEMKVTVSHENCLECGTCRYGCPFKAVTWTFPEGGMGVKYRYG